MQPPLILPQPISELVTDYTWNNVKVGKSSASTFYLKRPGSPTYYLKTADKSPRRDLLDEYNVLKWLIEKLPVPNVYHFEEDDKYDYLLLSEIPGANAANITDSFHKTELVKLLAQGLRMIHETPVEDCPFDRTLEVQMEFARFNVEHDLVNEGDFDKIRRGISAEELYEELVLRKPDEEDLVFIHGDYCLPNIIINQGQVSGFVDLHRAGISDRYKDLAIAVRSIKSNIGYNYESVFFNEYGISKPKAEKVEYYQLLDEFF